MLRCSEHDSHRAIFYITRAREFQAAKLHWLQDLALVNFPVPMPQPAPNSVFVVIAIAMHLVSQPTSFPVIELRPICICISILLFVPVIFSPSRSCFPTSCYISSTSLESVIVFEVSSPPCAMPSYWPKDRSLEHVTLG